MYFDIELLFKGGAEGRTMLKLPSDWAGQKRLYDGIRSICADSPEVVIHGGDAPEVRLVEHRAGQTVRISYQLHQDSNSDLNSPGRCFRPILHSEYFHLIGEAMFVHPDWDETIPMRIDLHWRNIPSHWTLSNSFGANQRVQSISRPLKQLRHAIYVGGDFRINQTLISENSLYTAIRGCWKFSDEEFAELVKTITRTEREFWNDADFPYFLVTLIPTGEKCCSYAGTGLTDSFAAFISTDKPIDIRLKHLLAHEMLHTWNGRKIRRRQPEELVYWFSEGFTDYYTRLLLLRSGLITLEEYLTDYNKVISEYYCSPYRNEKNDRILKDYWNIRDIKRLPYQRGDILAHNWNAAIRHGSCRKFSLDDVMIDLLKAARKDGVVVEASTINELITPYLKRGILDEIMQYIDDGVLMRPDVGALGPGFELKAVETRKFDLGFDYQACLSTNLVSGLRSESRAFEAGLRNGQEIIGRSIFFGNPTKPAEIKVRDREGAKTVRFLPAGEAIVIPQYTLDSQRFEKEKRECLLWFGL
jgi:predicted metalloprotease with PDZ domain